eukprot:CAMPEP_0175431468 /NCGR_PEP_ID=MMETSP0095-20121207/52391_1 /TAXON_ID=311494 /ORGANISM="Alexandrium monilatum, Strain CCMP3105" /LENGTH=136 /DNA_ID=CAMNT_0016730953 /DNA_START=98 /DNA_END=504 /DNA_ORIENTATION=-
MPKSHIVNHKKWAAALLERLHDDDRVALWRPTDTGSHMPRAIIQKDLALSFVEGQYTVLTKTRPMGYDMMDKALGTETSHLDNVSASATVWMKTRPMGYDKVDKALATETSPLDNMSATLSAIAAAAPAEGCRALA